MVPRSQGFPESLKKTTWPLQEMLSKAERLSGGFPPADLQALIDHTLKKLGVGGRGERGGGREKIGD